MFITLEGPDGSGKTTQMVALVAALRQGGLDVLATREPGGTPVGEQIRAIVHDLRNTDIVPRTEILLYLASRAQLVEQAIRPFLQSGGVVVCDRFADSTLAYQGYGHCTDLATLRMLLEFATGGLKPDLTLLLDIDAETGLRRRAADGEWNRLDAYDVAFHRRVRQGYLELAHTEPQRWVTIDAGRTPEQVQADLRRLVFARLRAQQSV
ncbi:MAG TPA: dTMP kinase [Anaerolineales bacterium]|nr:dTMP kinase [Anaerolineales bacterium]